MSDPITSSTSDRNPNRRFAQYESRDRIHFVILRYLRSPRHMIYRYAETMR